MEETRCRRDKGTEYSVLLSLGFVGIKALSIFSPMDGAADIHDVRDPISRTPYAATHLTPGFLDTKTSTAGYEARAFGGVAPCFLT